MDETGRNERKWYVALQTTHLVKHDKKINQTTHLITIAILLNR